MPFPKKRSDSKMQDNPEFFFHVEFNTTLNPLWKHRDEMPYNTHGFEERYYILRSDLVDKSQTERQKTLDQYYSDEEQTASFCRIVADLLSGERLKKVIYESQYNFESRRQSWTTTNYYKRRLLERGFFPVTIISKTYSATDTERFKDHLDRMFSKIYQSCDVGRSMENGIKVHIDIRRDLAVKKDFSSSDYFDLEDVRKIVKTSYWMEDALVDTIRHAEPKDTSIEDLSGDPERSLIRSIPPNMESRILRNTIATTEAFFAGKRLRRGSSNSFKDVNDLTKKIKSIEAFSSTFSPYAHHLMHVEPIYLTTRTKARVAYCLPSRWGDVDSVTHWIRTYLSYTYGALYAASFPNDLPLAGFKDYDAFIGKSAEYFCFPEPLIPDRIQRGEEPQRSRSEGRNDPAKRSGHRSRSRTPHDVQTDERRKKDKAPSQAQPSSSGASKPKIQFVLPDRPKAPSSSQQTRPSASTTPGPSRHRDERGGTPQSTDKTLRRKPRKPSLKSGEDQARR